MGKGHAQEGGTEHIEGGRGGPSGLIWTLSTLFQIFLPSFSTLTYTTQMAGACLRRPLDLHTGQLSMVTSVSIQVVLTITTCRVCLLGAVACYSKAGDRIGQ